MNKALTVGSDPAVFTEPTYPLDAYCSDTVRNVPCTWTSGGVGNTLSYTMSTLAGDVELANLASTF